MLAWNSVSKSSRQIHCIDVETVPFSGYCACDASHNHMVRQQVPSRKLAHNERSYQHLVVVMLDQELTELKPLGVRNDFYQIPMNE